MARITVTPDQHAELLRAAFSQIANPDDWKGPIDCTVPIKAASVYIQAIEFMTGTAPTGDLAGELLHIQSPGYRAGPAGDH